MITLYVIIPNKNIIKKAEVQTTTMYISQTLAEFLNNPMGKGSSVIVHRDQIRQYLDLKYDSLIRKFGDFEVKIYTHNDSYFYHLIIPSESQRRNTYDVVIQFVNDDSGKNNFSGDSTLKRYFIKLFSNSPSFTYTYAYVVNEYDCMVDQLQTKYPDVVLTNPPTTRNPGEILSYEKSTYYACKFLNEHRSLLDKSYIGRHSKSGIKDLIKEVRDTDKITLEIEKEKRRLEREGGNEGYVKLRKKSIKGKSVFDTRINKDAKVDKTNAEKDKIKRELHTSRKRETSKKSSTTNVIRPKPKIKAKKSNVKK